jgi:hypothetical protein
MANKVTDQTVQSDDGQLRDYVEPYYVEQRKGVWCVVTRNGSVITTAESRADGVAIVGRWDRNRYGS